MAQKKDIVEVFDAEKKELHVIDVSESHLEKVARGYFVGGHRFDNQKMLKEKLEEKIFTKIGRKGKYLTDKLFELIEGVYIIDKMGGRDGREIKMYQQPPNLQAIVYALDRVLGKPKAVTEHSESQQGIVLVEHIIKSLASNPQKRGVKNESQTANTTGKLYYDKRRTTEAGVSGGGSDGAESGRGPESGAVAGEHDNVQLSEAAV